MKLSDKALLTKFLEGHCTEQEKRRVHELLKNPEAQQLMQELTWGEWNDEILQPDEEMRSELQSWKKKLNMQLLGETDAVPMLPGKVGRLRLFLRYAAAILILVGIGSLAYWQLRSPATTQTEIAYIEKMNTSGVPVKYVLPDSSEVYLGAESKLSYSPDFNGHKREVRLEGEAFFEVTHMPSKPFIVHSRDINTQVFGTSFKVEAFSSQPTLVAVATGKVGVSKNDKTDSQQLALLTPGLKITWDSLSGKVTPGTMDIAALEQWKNGTILFNQEPFSRVSDILQRRFGVQLKIMDGTVSDYKVSATFDASEKVEDILDILSAMGEVRYQRYGEHTFHIYKAK